MYVMMNNVYRTERRNDRKDLDPNIIFDCIPKPLNVELLFHPFERLFNLAIILIKQVNSQSIKRQGVRQESESSVLLLVIKDDAT